MDMNKKMNDLCIDETTCQYTLYEKYESIPYKWVANVIPRNTPPNKLNIDIDRIWRRRANIQLL
jgi:hypothetical protein